jgi:DNA-binding CsgD family transcriptional regulator
MPGLPPHSSEQPPESFEDPRTLALIVALCDAALAALEVIPYAVLVVDKRGRPIITNRRAAQLLAAGDSLRPTPEGIAAADAPATAALRTAIAEAARASGRAPQTRTVALRSHCGAATVAAVVLPAPLSATPLGAERPAAVVFVATPPTGVGMRAESLHARYGITAAEAKLARALSDGCSLREAAQRLGVSVHTVRSQLKQLFEKTGTNRQAALVLLLVSHPLASLLRDLG